MRSVLVLILAAVALSASAAAAGPPEVLYFPRVKVLPKQDRTAHGTLYPSITRTSPAFCWDLELFARRQPLWAYLRRAGSGRVAARLYLGNPRNGPPWQGSSDFSGCAEITRADRRAFLRQPRLYYLDIRTVRAPHAAIAHPHGPRLHLP